MLGVVTVYLCLFISLLIYNKVSSIVPSLNLLLWLFLYCIYFVYFILCICYIDVSREAYKKCQQKYEKLRRKNYMKRAIFTYRLMLSILWRSLCFLCELNISILTIADALFISLYDIVLFCSLMWAALGIQCIPNSFSSFMWKIILYIIY